MYAKVACQGVWARGVRGEGVTHDVQVLASMSTRRVGKKLQGSVLASLTALTTAVEGLDKNVDYIFEDVFSGDFMRDIVTLDIDDFL